jgi:hypothetical protein
MLLADIDRLGGLAWGVIAESAYQVGHERYRDWAERQGLLWGPLFAAVGLPMCQVTAGVSEVGTSTIVRATRPDLVASCQFGPLGAPCGECWKCFRKQLLDAALAGAWPSDEAIEAMLRSPAVKAKLMKSPIKHEDVLAWILARYRGRHPVMLHLAAQTHAHEQDLDWLTRYYGPSIDILPAFLRDGTRTRLDAFLQPMAPQDEAAFRAWDMAPRLADPSTARAHAAVVRALGGRAPSRRRSLAGRVVGSLRRRLSG